MSSMSRSIASTSSPHSEQSRYARCVGVSDGRVHRSKRPAANATGIKQAESIVERSGICLIRVALPKTLQQQSRPEFHSCQPRLLIGIGCLKCRVHQPGNRSFEIAVVCLHARWVALQLADQRLAVREVHNLVPCLHIGAPTSKTDERPRSAVRGVTTAPHRKKPAETLCPCVPLHGELVCRPSRGDRVTLKLSLSRLASVAHLLLPRPRATDVRGASGSSTGELRAIVIPLIIPWTREYAAVLSRVGLSSLRRLYWVGARRRRQRSRRLSVRE